MIDCVSGGDDAAAADDDAAAAAADDDADDADATRIYTYTYIYPNLYRKRMVVMTRPSWPHQPKCKSYNNSTYRRAPS